MIDPHLNAWQYAIARVYAQLMQLSEQRELTNREVEVLEIVALRVEYYELGGRALR